MISHQRQGRCRCRRRCSRHCRRRRVKHHQLFSYKHFFGEDDFSERNSSNA